MRVGKRILYPSLYILLVGGPGVGKTDALRNVIDSWTELPSLHVAPTSVSRASLADELFKAKRQILRPADAKNPFVTFNSLNAAVTEFGTFLTAYDGEFISTLNDLYDCIKYKESKRHMKEPLVIENPQLNIIAGTTPAWLGGSLPQTAWAEGFSSRLLMIYSGERAKVANLFYADEIDEAVRAGLISDLKQIHDLYGEFQIEPEFVTTLNTWYQADCPPIPDHPKLEHYLPRRHIHFLKLAMIYSISRSNELVLRMEDFHAAQDTLLEAEAFMPDVFKAMRFTTDVNYYDETYTYVYTTFNRENAPVAENRIIHFIGQRAPGHQVVKVLEHMVSAGYLQVASVAGPGGRPTYKPSPRGQFGS